MPFRLLALRKRGRIAGAITVSLIALIALTSTGCSDGVSAARVPSILFSATAQNASISMTSADEGSLMIAEATPVLWFTDRPGRAAGSMTIGDLVNGWTINKFDTDPPNAALVITTLKATTQHVVTLDSPVTSGGSTRFHFAINPDGEESGITHIHDVVSGTFDRVELFIDDAALPECPDYITAKAHSVTKCLISPGDGYEKSYQFDQVGLNGTFQLCATAPGLSVYDVWGIPQCPGEVSVLMFGPWDGPVTYEIGGKPPVIVTATFHGKSKIPKWQPPAGVDDADGAEGPSD